jgi:phosphoribosylglycinamide formyltransferase 1
MNIAVFCSGNGSNFQAIADAAGRAFMRVKISLMVCDNPLALAIKRAEKTGIPCILKNRKDFPSQEALEKDIISHLKQNKTELICLAGYMKVLSPFFIKQYPGRIINVHPSLLPAFKGARAIEDAFNYGVKITGVTVHFVTEDVDAGPIILQEPVEIKSNDTLPMLEERIHAVEHRLYPLAVKLFAENKIKIQGRTVTVYE